MLPAGLYLCECFSCADEGCEAAKGIGRSTGYLHRQADKRPHLAMSTGGTRLAHDHGGTSAGAFPGAGVAAGEAIDDSSEEGTVTGSGADAGGVPHTDTAATADSRTASEPAGDGRPCDADETPEPSETSNSSSESDPEDVPPLAFDAESVQQGAAGPPPSPNYQPDVSTSEIMLPIAQFKDNTVDLALYAYTVNHDSTQASITDLLRLSSTTFEYRTPYLMKHFIDASVHLETRAVDFCLIGCVACTHTRSQKTTWDACGAPR